MVLGANVIGIPLGILIGIITGVVAIFFVRSMISSSPRSIKTVIALATELLSLPTFWTGGPWVTGKLFVNIKWEEVLTIYMFFLAISFISVFVWPLCKLIIRVCREIDRLGE